MFDISITVENINFEKTISALMPGILQKCRKISKPNLVLRMLLEMEDDALTVLLGIMQRLSEDAKVELLCQLMNGYGEVLTEKFNEYLKKDALGRNFRFQSIYMRKRNNGVELVGCGVQIDYMALLDEEEVREKISDKAADFVGFGKFGKILARQVGNVLKTAVGAAPEEAEKFGLKLLQREDIKERLLKLAQDVLEQKGMEMELKSLFLEQTEEEGIILENNSGTIEISPELELELIKALAGYVRSVYKSALRGGRKVSDLQRFIDRLEQTSGKRKEAGLAMDFQREQHRIFAVNENGTVIAEITFPEREGVYVIDHTFVDESLRGQGVAKVLMEMAIAQIKEQKGKVEATCSYAQRFLEKHPQ